MTDDLTTRDGVRAAVARLSIPGEAIVDGAAAGAADGATFDNIGPGDGRLLGRVASGSAADIDCAVRAARAAFEDGRWRDQRPRARKKVLHRLADLLEAHADELALLE